MVAPMWITWVIAIGSRTIWLEHANVKRWMRLKRRG